MKNHTAVHLPASVLPSTTPLHWTASASQVIKKISHDYTYKTTNKVNSARLVPPLLSPTTHCSHTMPKHTTDHIDFLQENKHLPSGMITSTRETKDQKYCLHSVTQPPAPQWPDFVISQTTVGRRMLSMNLLTTENGLCECGRLW